MTFVGIELIASTYLALSETHYYQNRLDSCSWYRYAALRELENNQLLSPRMQLGRIVQHSTVLAKCA